MGLKTDDTPMENSIDVNLIDNVGQQIDDTSQIDHVSDKKMDYVGWENIGGGDHIET